MFTTNEAGEIILVEEANSSPVKKSRSKKKEKEEKFLPPFFSEEYFNFLISEHGVGEGNIQTTPHLLLKWKNEQYLPLYSLGIKTPINIPYYEYRLVKNNPDNNIWQSARIGTLLKTHTPVHGFKYFEHLLKTKNYRLLSFFNESYISPAVEIDFNVRMKELVDRQFKLLLDQAPTTAILVPNNFKQGTPRLMNKFKFNNEWRWTQIKQSGINYSDMPVYISNLGFIGRQVTWNNHTGGGNNMGMWPIKPLACCVIKLEHYSLVKHYILANEPIPTELIQLWVDKSLEPVLGQPVAEPIMSSFVRQIKNPYKKLGMEIIIKDSLVDELYTRPELKRFRTQMEQMNWVEDILKEFTIIERNKLGIS